MKLIVMEGEKPNPTHHTRISLQTLYDKAVKFRFPSNELARPEAVLKNLKNKIDPVRFVKATF